jgi:hypothetical protein
MEAEYLRRWAQELDEEGGRKNSERKLKTGGRK